MGPCIDQQEEIQSIALEHDPRQAPQRCTRVKSIGFQLTSLSILLWATQSRLATYYDNQHVQQ
jgi:hypothetical protein